MKLTPPIHAACVHFWFTGTGAFSYDRDPRLPAETLPFGFVPVFFLPVFFDPELRRLEVGCFGATGAAGSGSAAACTGAGGAKNKDAAPAVSGGVAAEVLGRAGGRSGSVFSWKRDASSPRMTRCAASMAKLVARLCERWPPVLGRFTNDWPNPLLLPDLRTGR